MTTNPTPNPNKKFTDLENSIMFHKATERAGTGEFDNFFEDGIYTCKNCESALEVISKNKKLRVFEISDFYRQGSKMEYKSIYGGLLAQESNHFNLELENIELKKTIENSIGSVLLSDSFSPFRDSIDLITKYRTKIIIQLCCSLRDQEVFDLCNENRIEMFYTGNLHPKQQVIL
jgi:AICAR transformylase/IMP cyclohydrolase PurH